MSKIRYNAIEASKTFQARVKDPPKPRKVKVEKMKLSPTPSFLKTLMAKNKNYGKLP